jgi:hypothetical protein
VEDRAFEVCEHASGLRDQGMTGLCEVDPAAGPFEQGDVELPFETLDLVGQRGLGDPEAVSGATEVEMLCDLEERGEQRSVHRSRISIES